MISKVLLVVQLAIGLVLLLASAGKWRKPMGFAHGVADYQVLPDRLSIVFGLLLIPLETVLAASHLTGWWISVASPLALVMFASFALAVAINLVRGRSLPCYCFGENSRETISAPALGRLLLLLTGEGLLLTTHARAGTSRLVFQQLATLREFAFALFWTVLLIVAVMWLLSLTDLFELLRSRSSLAGHQQLAGPLVREGALQ